MKMQKARRRENVTDYKKRISLLKGGRPRIVFRKTNRYLTAQYVTSEETKDRVEIGASSKALEKYGWPKEFKNSLKSIPAAYLLGFLIGKRIAKAGKETPIADFGMMRVLHKSRPFAFLKGIIDSGLNIKQGKDAFPSQDKISGKNLKGDFSEKFMEIKSKMEKE
jgi:large subunit ribosomal protein L18